MGPVLVRLRHSARPGSLTAPSVLSVLVVSAWLVLGSNTAASDEPVPSPEQVARPRADDSGTSSTKEDDPRASAEHVETVVVTATRSRTPVGRVGSAVTVIDAERIERSGAWLAADVLRGEAGLDVRRAGGPGSTTSVFLRGADSDHTLVLLDGIELNDPSAPSRGPLLGDLTLDGIERIEVLRGPQSTLYGSDAMGGVIQLFTRRGDGDVRTSLWTEGGSFGTLRGGIRHSGGTERASYSVGVSRTDTDGFSATAEGSEDDPYRNTSVTGSFGLGLEDTYGLDLVFHHVNARVAFDGFDEEADHSIDTRQSLVKVQPRVFLWGGRWRQTLGLEAARHERDTAAAVPSRVRGDLYSLDWQNDLAVAERHTVTAGADIGWEDAELSGFEDRARTVGVYVQERFAGRRWFGTAGARVDDHSAFGARTTFRLAGGNRLNERGTVLRGSIGTGFKAPSLSESDPLAFGGNPDLEPETSRGADLGIEHRFALGRERRLGLIATIFHNEFEDLIVAVFDPATGTFQNVNVDEAEASGVELELDVVPTDSVHLRATYTFTGTEAKGSPRRFGLTEGSRLLRRPDHKAGLDVNWRLRGDRANLRVSLGWVGERDDLDPASFEVTEVPSFLVVDLAAFLDVGRSVRVFGRVDNLLDEEYEEIFGFGTPGRSAYAGMRLTF